MGQCCKNCMADKEGKSIVIISPSIKDIIQNIRKRPMRKKADLAVVDLPPQMAKDDNDGSEGKDLIVPYGFEFE